ncbi:MMPL family transporter [Streptomyces microflavus]|uniref:MMPL family transporter n=1 Tax=Streptomyces microflavus TaxID=1919 RepID=UPI0033F46BAE
MKSSSYAEFNRQADESVEKNLLTAESTAVPTTLLLLILVFRSGAAAPLPLAFAGVSVVGSPTLPVVVAQFTSVPVFATDLTTALLLRPGNGVGNRHGRSGHAWSTSAHQRPPEVRRTDRGPGAGQRRSATKP